MESCLASSHSLALATSSKRVHAREKSPDTACISGKGRESGWVIATSDTNVTRVLLVEVLTILDQIIKTAKTKLHTCLTQTHTTTRYSTKPQNHNT